MLKGGGHEWTTHEAYGYCDAEREYTWVMHECPLEYFCPCSECGEFTPALEVDDEYGYCEDAAEYIDDMHECPSGGAFKVECSECDYYNIKEE